MKKVLLTKNQFAIIDDQDFENVNQYRWFAVAPSENCYSHTWYAARNNDGRRIALHVFLLNPPKGQCVDHINGDGLDNRRNNLRLSTATENSQNSRKYANSTSIFKGVNWNSQKKKWQSRICINKKEVHLGWFKDETVAAETYDFVATQFFGPFARLNFPEAVL